MSTINDGGPAFPNDVRILENYMDGDGYGKCRHITLSQGGMTLRQWFAGQALAGLSSQAFSLTPESAAIAARIRADALLKELEK